MVVKSVSLLIKHVPEACRRSPETAGSPVGTVVALVEGDLTGRRRHSWRNGVRRPRYWCQRSLLSVFSEACACEGRNIPPLLQVQVQFSVTIRSLDMFQLQNLMLSRLTETEQGINQASYVGGIRHTDDMGNFGGDNNYKCNKIFPMGIEFHRKNHSLDQSPRKWYKHFYSNLDKQKETNFQFC